MVYGDSPNRLLLSRTLLWLLVGLNQRRPPRCRRPRASWSQTQNVPAPLSLAARWMRPTRSTPRLRIFFGALRKSTEPHVQHFFLSTIWASSDLSGSWIITQICCFRLKNSNKLETSLQNGKNLLSTYENKLAREEVAPSDISSLEKTQRELAVRLALALSGTHVAGFDICLRKKVEQWGNKKRQKA